jgi:hypothetical protein
VLEKPLFKTNILGNLGYIRFEEDIVPGNNPPIAPIRIPENPPSQDPRRIPENPSSKDLHRIPKKKPPKAKLTKNQKKREYRKALGVQKTKSELKKEEAKGGKRSKAFRKRLKHQLSKIEENF